MIQVLQRRHFRHKDRPLPIKHSKSCLELPIKLSLFGVKTSWKAYAYGNKESTVCSLRYEKDGLKLENWGRDQLVQQKGQR